MRKGLFISLEGSDGSGKSTQLDLIKAYFNDIGIHPLITREPGGTVIGEIIRELVLSKKYSEIGDRTEALLYAAARSQHVKEVIAPALELGKVVICDRFIDSSIVYQGYGRKLGEPVKIINEFAIAGCLPDKTFLFKIDPEIGKSRISAESRDRLECEKIEFYNEVLRGYEELERRYPDRFIGIDASGGIEDIHLKIRRHLNDILEGKYDIKRIEK